MPQIQLTPAERKVFRADAHHLDPVVMIGGDGLTPAVVKETEAALNAHGLIKIRVLGDDRTAREAMFAQLADQLNAAPNPAHRQIADPLASTAREDQRNRRRPQSGSSRFQNSEIQLTGRSAP
jgi:RNA-binding protein YhbY